MTEPVPADARVAEFLRAAGRHLELDEQTLRVWRPVVVIAGRPDDESWRAARHIAAQGQVPTVESIEQEVRRRRERTAAAAAAVRTDADAYAGAAQAYVAEVRARTGAGPTWGELRRHLGWRRAQGEPRIKYMVDRGHLVSTQEERSLALPTGRRAAAPGRASPEVE